jgi:hypothetical protein
VGIGNYSTHFSFRYYASLPREYVITFTDIDECKEPKTPCKEKLEECVNTEGSFKCVSKLKKKTKLLPDEDYDAEDDEEDDDYEEGGITEPSLDESCELGYKKDDKGVCIGKYGLFPLPPPLLFFLFSNQNYIFQQQSSFN